LRFFAENKEFMNEDRMVGDETPRSSEAGNMQSWPQKTVIYGRREKAANFAFVPVLQRRRENYFVPLRVKFKKIE
jgi:hypothetical protein